MWKKLFGRVRTFKHEERWIWVPFSPSVLHIFFPCWNKIVQGISFIINSKSELFYANKVIFIYIYVSLLILWQKIYLRVTLHSSFGIEFLPFLSNVSDQILMKSPCLSILFCCVIFSVHDIWNSSSSFSCYLPLLTTISFWNSNI